MPNIMQVHVRGERTYNFSELQTLASEANPNMKQRDEARKIIEQAEKQSAKVPVIKEICRR